MERFGRKKKKKKYDKVLVSKAANPSASEKLVLIMNDVSSESDIVPSHHICPLIWRVWG